MQNFKIQKVEKFCPTIKKAQASVNRTMTFAIVILGNIFPFNQIR